MGKTSTLHKILTSVSLTLIILNVFSAILFLFLVLSHSGTAGIDIMFIFFSIFTISFYILMNWFTFYTLKNIGLIIYNSILFICEFVYFYNVYFPNSYSFGIVGWALAIFCASNPIFLIIDIIVFFIRKYFTNEQNSNNDYGTDQVYIQNVEYSQDKDLPKEPIAITQYTMPNTQFIEPTNNQPIVQEQNGENHFAQQNVKNIQDENVVENNVTIDLNKLTPEQKDQLLTVLLQNNQKTNE